MPLAMNISVAPVTVIHLLFTTQAQATRVVFTCFEAKKWLIVKVEKLRLREEFRPTKKSTSTAPLRANLPTPI